MQLLVKSAQQFVQSLLALRNEPRKAAIRILLERAIDATILVNAGAIRFAKAQG